MKDSDILVMGGDYEKILALAKAVHRPANSFPVPFASMPASNVYVRQPEGELAVPVCLDQVAKMIRTQGVIPALVRDWFSMITDDTALRLKGHKWVDDPEEVPSSPKAKSDRILTPRYTVDTAELDGKRLAAFLGISIGIYEEMTARIERASASFAMQYPKQTPKLNMVTTRPRLFIKLEAYMLECFAWVVTGGGIEPGE